MVVGVERNVVEKVKLPIRNWGVAGIGVAGLTSGGLIEAAKIATYIPPGQQKGPSITSQNPTL